MCEMLVSRVYLLAERADGREQTRPGLGGGAPEAGQRLVHDVGKLTVIQVARDIQGHVLERLVSIKVDQVI